MYAGNQKKKKIHGSGKQTILINLNDELIDIFKIVQAF